MPNLFDNILYMFFFSDLFAHAKVGTLKPVATPNHLGVAGMSISKAASLRAVMASLGNSNSEIAHRYMYMYV